jgi:hypothetical protein
LPYCWYAATFAAFVLFTPSFPPLSPVFTVWHAHCFVTLQRIKMQLINLEKSVFCAIAGLALTTYCNASESKKPGGGEDRHRDRLSCAKSAFSGGLPRKRIPKKPLSSRIFAKGERNRTVE